MDNEKYDVIMPLGSAIPSTAGKRTVVTENLTQTPFTLVTENKKDLPPLNKLRVGMPGSLGGGAETAEQADFLKDKGCSEMQGYYFYKPMPVTVFEEAVKEL